MFRLLLPLMLATASVAVAELTWEKPLQEFHRAPEDNEVVAKFAFKNTGVKPVEITRVASSCGCTTTRLEKRKIAPGESGEIEARFTFGGRRGEQRKTISVTTDDGRQVALELRCWIEETLTIAPALVFWRIGDEPAAKAVDVNVAGGQNVAITSIRSSNPRLKATLRTIEAGKHYTIEVQPTDTTQREIGQLAVQTDFPPDAPRSYTIHARVK